MRVAVLTFYGALNYGAMLQAFALWRYLEGIGHEVVFIKHFCTAPARLPLWRCFFSRRIRGIRKKLESYVWFSMRSFVSALPQTEYCKSLEDIMKATSACDGFIVGSDQMWNPMWCATKWLPLVMLDFVPNGKKRIAYAVSFGTNTWGCYANEDVAGSMIRKFDSISVREHSGLALIEEISGREDAKWLIDPTLLFGAEFYSQVSDSSRYKVCPDKGKYIFKYMLGGWDDKSDASYIIDALKKSKGILNIQCDRVRAMGWLPFLSSAFGVKARISVCSWLRKIEGAGVVVTNSYHGVIFSIIYHRPFVAILLRGHYEGMNDRILSLLVALGLERLAVYSDDIAAIKAAISLSIDWVDVESRLDTYRNTAKMFLMGCLNGL